MSIVTESPLSSPGEVAPHPARNAMQGLYSNTLLSFRDDALLLAYRMSGDIADAEDILQNAYLKAVRLAAPQRTGPELRVWFLKLTANTARDWRRSEHRRREREKYAASDAPLVTPEASQDIEHNELKRQVNAEVAKLDEKSRAPICLHYEQGLTYDEAAEVLGVPASSLRVNASRGVQLLRERLDRPQQPVSAELVGALLATATALTASQTLAATIDKIVITGVPTTAQAPALQHGAGGIKVFTAVSGASSALLLKALVAAVIMLSLSTATLGWMFYQERQAYNAAVSSSTSTPVIPEESTAAENSVETPANQAAADDPLPPVQNPPLQPVNDVNPLPGANAPWIGFVPQLEAGADYVPPAEIEALWQNTLNLIPLVRMDRDPVAGKWSRKEGELHQAPAQFSRIRLNYIPPEEYDFRVDFTRLGGETETIQMLPLNRATAAWHIESWGSHYWGPLKDNPHVTPAAHLANGRRHTSIIEVRRVGSPGTELEFAL